jgi:hypothetical protein
LIVPPPKRILYCYGEFQPSVSEFPEVEFHEGLPDVSRFDGRHRFLLIIDDLTNETNQNVCNLFTKLSYHRTVSVVFITQNVYHRNRFIRTMNLNTHYIVLFKNPRDANQVTPLARQIYPGKSKFVVEAFKDATKNPYGYLLIDLKPKTDERYRIHTNILPDDDRQYVCISKVFKRMVLAMKIDRDEFASAASSAGNETVEAFGGEGQTEIPENLRRTVHRLSVQVS